MLRAIADNKPLNEFARELASRNITVNVVTPGMIDTDMTRAISDKAQVDWAAQIPLGRLGTVDDIGEMAAFLVSPLASYVTGCVLVCDPTNYSCDA